MSDFKELMEIRDRMHKTIYSCKNCPISMENNNRLYSCDSFIVRCPEEAEKILLDWDKEHPAMTNGEKVKEILESAFGIQINATTDCELIKCDHYCEKCKYRDFWKREYKER